MYTENAPTAKIDMDSGIISCFHFMIQFDEDSQTCHVSFNRATSTKQIVLVSRDLINFLEYTLCMEVDVLVGFTDTPTELTFEDED
jgi:hypothetical protein